MAHVRDTAQEFVEDNITLAHSFANDAYGQAMDYLNQIVGLLGSIDIPQLDINVPVIDVPDINIETPPDIDALDIDFAIPSDIPAMPAYVESGIEQALNLVYDNIYATITTGGSGITEAVEDAIYNRARSRLDEEFRDELEKLEHMYSSRGHVASPGVVAGMMTRLSSEVVRKTEDLNNDIIVNQTKLAQQQTQFALTMCIELFKVYLQKYATQVTAYGEAIKGYAIQIQAVISTIEAHVRLFEADVKQYIATAGMQKTYFDTLATKIKMELDKAKIESDILISEMEANLKAYIAVKDLNLEAMKTGGSISAQLAASSLSSINTATGFNYSGSYSASKSTQESLSTGYSQVDQHIYPH